MVCTKRSNGEFLFLVSIGNQINMGKIILIIEKA